MKPICHLGEVWHNRIVIASAPDAVTQRIRMNKARGRRESVTQRTKRWTVRCLSCKGETTTTWQAVRLKGCFQCTMKSLRKPDFHVAVSRCMTSWKFGAAARGLAWDLSRAACEEIMQSPCHYCGRVGANRQMKRDREIRYNGPDRKNNLLGYTLENVLPCCGVCNRAKNAMSYEDFLAWIDAVVVHAARRAR